MKRLTHLALAFAVIALFAGVQAEAQEEGLAFLIENLFETVELDNDFHEAHFTSEGQLRLINDTFVSAFAPQLTTVPVGSPGGGFTFTYDSETGVFSRSSQSFGSLFSERALTIGRGKWNVGIAAQSVEYDEFGSIDLTGTGVNFQLLHVDSAGDSLLNPAFEGDVIDTAMSVNLTSETTTLVVTYGISDRFDISFAVPHVSTELDVDARLEMVRLASGDPEIHGFNLNDPNLDVVNEDLAFARGRGDASGIGDILVRGKYRFRDAPGGGMAAGVDLRLATGDESDLLGTGGSQVKLFLIGSREFGRFAPLFNVGYTFSGVGGQVLDTLPDEINYALGFSVAAGSRVTVAAEVVGRRLLDAPNLRQGTGEFFFTTALGAPVQVAQRGVVESTLDDLDVTIGSVGLRINPFGSLLISANALFSMSDDGLIDEDVIPVVSLDYSF